MKLRTFDNIWNRRLAEFLRNNWKLEVNEAMTLVYAENYPLTSQAKISAALELHPNIMVGLVRRLRHRRLIVVKHHPRDGRKVTIMPTPQGLEIVRKIRARQAEMLALVFWMGLEEPRRTALLDEVVTLAINAEVQKI